LGQLFDHGCDAVNLIFTVFMTWAAFDMRPSMAMAINGVFCTIFGNAFIVIIIICVGYLVFLTSTWEEYHTHVLNLGVINGPVEGSLMVSAAALASAAFGTDFWHRTAVVIGGASVEWNNALYLVVGGGSVFTITASLYECIQKKGLLAILPSFVATVGPQYLCLLWFGLTPQLWNTQGLVIFLIYSGFCATTSIFSIIIATVTRAPFPYWNATLLTVICGLANTLIGKLWTPIINDRDMMLTCMWIAITLNMHFAFSVIDQLCTYLGIHCLRIKTADKKKTL
jgi:ethanolaminephosphotransferase